MSIMPPSPFCTSESVTAETEPAVASLPPPVEAAAGPNSPPLVRALCPQGESEPPVTVASGGGEAVADLFGSDISHVTEIFHWARELVKPTRFVLDERAFMEAIEPPPLFLQRAFG